MTRSVRGTAEAPGRNVHQKAGLNRSILDNTPGERRRQLAYKASRHGSELRLVPPSGTSQTCSACGTRDPESRQGCGRVFACTTCGHQAHADLNAAVEALGPRAVAATGVSPSLAERELEDARAFATELGVRHVVVPTHEQDRPGYLANGPDRCYFCKAELFEVLAPLAEAEGLALAVGTNADDLGDWRPGQRAAAERGVRTPLVAAGFSKRDVREASRRMGLRTHDKPAAACLASRVAYGIQVTPARLSRVERAEALVRSFGLAQLRVRDHGELARVEVPVDALPLLVREDARGRLVEGLRELGFAYVTLDLEGFRSGSMNAAVRP